MALPRSTPRRSEEDYQSYAATFLLWKQGALIDLSERASAKSNLTSRVVASARHPISVAKSNESLDIVRMTTL